MWIQIVVACKFRIELNMLNVSWLKKKKFTLPTLILSSKKRFSSQSRQSVSPVDEDQSARFTNQNTMTSTKFVSMIISFVELIFTLIFMFLCVDDASVSHFDIHGVKLTAAQYRRRCKRILRTLTSLPSKQVKTPVTAQNKTLESTVATLQAELLTVTREKTLGLTDAQARVDETEERVNMCVSKLDAARAEASRGSSQLLLMSKQVRPKDMLTFMHTLSLWCLAIEFAVLARLVA